MPPDGLRNPSHGVENLDPLAQIQMAILQRMHRQDDSSKIFICDRELRTVWEFYNLRDIFPSQRWWEDERQKIRAEYLKVLSILICIDWTDLELLFRPYFFMRPDQDRNDASLPLSETQLGFLRRSAHLFSQMQYAFIPVIIEEHDTRYIQQLRSKERLPFIEDSLEIGSGGFGVVSKVIIAPEYLFHTDNRTKNSEVGILLLLDAQTMY